MTPSHDWRIAANGLVVAPARPAGGVRGRPQVPVGSIPDGGGHLAARSILRRVVEAGSWNRWGALLPLAFVVAVSPAPILAIILMLLTPRADVTSAGFMVGWIVGISAVTTVSSLLAGTSSPSSTAASWVQVVLGVLLLAFAVRRWRSRPRHGAEPEVPSWLAAIDRLTAVRAGGLGLVLSAVNPKNLLVCVAAGLTIAGGGLSAAQGGGPWCSAP